MKALEILERIHNECEASENFMGYTYDAEKVDKIIDEAIAELEALDCKKIINLCDGCKFEYWSYGKKFCQYDYECKRGCSMYADMYEERQ